MGMIRVTAKNGHEIMITVPSRDDMQVEVVGDTGSGGGAHIPSHIKSLSFDDLLKQTLGITRQIHEFYFLAVGQFRQTREIMR